jgi:hypothetical protein
MCIRSPGGEGSDQFFSLTTATQKSKARVTRGSLFERVWSGSISCVRIGTQNRSIRQLFLSN